MLPAVGWARVAEELQAARPVQLAAELVRLPSHPGVARQEEAVALHLAAWLEGRGVRARLEEAVPGRPNVLAGVRAAEPARGRRLVLCGHSDTVPLNAGASGAGFSGELRDGLLLGRGSADMKGGLAAMAGALVALERTGALPAGSVTLAAVVDEEMQSLGAEALVRSGLRADGAVVGEPTGNRVALGHKGLEWLELRFHGRSAHAGRAEQGVSAIRAALRFGALVEERLLPRFAARSHALLGPPALNFGTVHGGDQPSTVAAHCALTLDRRTVPGESFATVKAELLELCAEVERELPGLRCELLRLPSGMATMEHVALELAADHPLAAAAQAASARVLGAASPPVAFPAWTDGALLSAFGGLPALVLGPGDLALAHSPREACPAAEIEAAAALYAAIALEFCGSGP